MTDPCTSSLTSRFPVPSCPLPTSHRFFRLHGTFKLPSSSSAVQMPPEEDLVFHLTPDRRPQQALVGAEWISCLLGLYAALHASFPLGPSSLPTWDHLAHLLFNFAPVLWVHTSHERPTQNSKFSSIPGSRSASVLVSREIWKAAQSSISLLATSSNPWTVFNLCPLLVVLHLLTPNPLSIHPALSPEPPPMQCLSQAVRDCLSAGVGHAGTARSGEQW